MEYIVFRDDGEDEMESHTHLYGTANDYTLCGITLDGDTETAGTFDVITAKKLTCPDCVRIVRSCRDKLIKI